MYGAFSAVVTALKDAVGSPYDLIPLDMMRYGEGGMAGYGSLCGAINGASAAITLVAGEEHYKKLVTELLTWYTQTPLPTEISNQYAVNHEFLVDELKTDEPLPQSVSGSTLCHVSVTKWCLASGYASGSKERSERCGRLTGDVAAKAVELLNLLADNAFESALSLSEEAETCRACHKKGDDFDAGQFTRGKENCLNCHENPHK
ncbi:MAG TPA: C_GCAxxG_C_C family protein [Thermoflexia bacterium]|jgi:hypothetical protein|nr:C_GCAxxG_C_C family protein [Thermoflexia bacterium]